MWAMGDGIPVDKNALEDRISKAIVEIVEKQVKAGVTIINDGEMSKPSYATYVKDRLSGFAGESIQNYFFDEVLRPLLATQAAVSVLRLHAPAPLRSSTRPQQ
jgi:5-methyltetrahydropteroyltriglutamate--homocysteine methyltransferase